MATWIILGIIGVYFFYVIYKKVKDMKNGKFCSCGCDSCPSKGKCKDIKNNEK